jgi:hypothetical protein
MPLPRLHLEVHDETLLRYDDGAPVRAASAVAAFSGGWLVVSDDETRAAHWTAAGVRPLRLLPPVDGLDAFSEAEGTKDRKPDLEAACTVSEGRVVALPSGSSDRRQRGVLVDPDAPPRVADLRPLLEAASALLDVEPGRRNLEGACALGGVLRWFQRGAPEHGVASASVDADLAALLEVLMGDRPPGTVAVGRPRRYALAGTLGITDAVALPDGRILASAAAEDTPDPVADGPVREAALVLLAGEEVIASAPLVDRAGQALKVEGLALERVEGDLVRVVAVADVDDHEHPSPALRITVTLPR